MTCYHRNCCHDYVFLWLFYPQYVYWMASFWKVCIQKNILHIILLFPYYYFQFPFQPGKWIMKKSSFHSKPCQYIDQLGTVQLSPECFNLWPPFGLPHSKWFTRVLHSLFFFLFFFLYGGKFWQFYLMFFLSNFQLNEFQKNPVLDHPLTGQKFDYQWVFVNGTRQNLNNVCLEASKKFFNWNIAVFTTDEMRWAF